MNHLRKNGGYLLVGFVTASFISILLSYRSWGAIDALYAGVVFAGIPGSILGWIGGLITKKIWGSVLGGFFGIFIFILIAGMGM